MADVTNVEHHDEVVIGKSKQNPATLYRCPECGMTTEKSNIALNGEHVKHLKTCSRFVQA